MPIWMMIWVRDMLLNKSTAAIAGLIRKDDPAAVEFLKQFKAGASFMDCVKAYTAATPNKEDDAVAVTWEELKRRLETEPFSEVLASLAGPLATIHIPDGDGDTTNDITVGEILNRIIDKIVE